MTLTASPPTDLVINVINHTLSDGSEVYDLSFSLYQRLACVTEEDAAAFVDGLISLVEAHTNSSVSVNHIAK